MNGGLGNIAHLELKEALGRGVAEFRNTRIILLECVLKIIV
jgi:hypothetical protein